MAVKEPSKAKTSSTNASAWVGGRIPLPEIEGEVRYLSLWLDPDQGIVGFSVEPAASADLGALLEVACREPQVGAPRQPASVRVASPDLAAEIQRSQIPVAIVIAPTPEVTAITDQMLSELGLDEAPPANFFGGPFSPIDDVTLDMVAASKLGDRFLAAAPWRWIGEATQVAVSAPSLGLDAGVSCVVGHLAEHFGFALCRDLAAFRKFRELAERGAFEKGPPLAATQLMFDVTPGAVSPSAAAARAKRQPAAMQCTHLTPSWEAFEADAREHALLFAVAEAYAALTPERGSVTVGPVTLTVRAEPTRSAAVLPFARPGSTPSSPPAKRPDRNDPCWCGSGKKYKKCHLDADAGASSAATSAPAGRTRWGKVLDRMYPRLRAWAESNVRYWREHLASFAPIRASELHLSHALFGSRAETARVSAGEAYREAVGASLGAEDRRWLDANIDTAWTSYWSVLEVVPGVSLTLRDIFSEEVRTIVEASASRMLGKHALLCARIVTVDDESYMDVAHPTPLGPREAAFLRRHVATSLGFTKIKAVPLAKLRTERATFDLLAIWEAAVEHQSKAAPVLHNTDGHPLVLVTQRFPIALPAADIAARIGALPGAHETDHETWIITKAGNAMHASWDNTTIATLTLEGTTVVVDTNSRERADALAELFIATFGAALGKPTRSEQTATELLATAPPARPLTAVPPVDQQALLAEFKHRHYATWPDDPLPAFGGKTARQLVKTAAGKKQVAALLDEMEAHEQRALPPERYDFDLLRRELGLLQQARGSR